MDETNKIVTHIVHFRARYVLTAGAAAVFVAGAVARPHITSRLNDLKAEFRRKPKNPVKDTPHEAETEQVQPLLGLVVDGVGHDAARDERERDNGVAVAAQQNLVDLHGAVAG